MASTLELDPSPLALPALAPRGADALRSRAWRARHGDYLRGIVEASGAAVVPGGQSSHMAQLKRLHAPLWAATLAAAPALSVRHDGALPRHERRRMSSIKNNRLCRLRHALFLDHVEAELAARGISAAWLLQIKGLRAS